MSHKALRGSLVRGNPGCPQKNELNNPVEGQLFLLPAVIFLDVHFSVQWSFPKTNYLHASLCLKLCFLDELRLRGCKQTLLQLLLWVLQGSLHGVSLLHILDWASTSLFSGMSLASSQDCLPSVWGPVQNETIGCLAQKVLRISR